MNPLPTIRKNIASIEYAFKSIKSQQTKDAAHEMVHRFYSGLFEVPSTVGAGTTVSVPVEAPIAIGGVGTPISSQNVCTAIPEPVSAPEVEGDLPGETGTFYIETVMTETVATAVEQIGGWPVVAEMTVIGLAPNRRTVKGRLEDGRIVSLERSGAWKAGDVVGVKLIRAGTFPLFRVG